MNCQQSGAIAKKTTSTVKISVIIKRILGFYWTVLFILIYYYCCLIIINFISVKLLFFNSRIIILLFLLREPLTMELCTFYIGGIFNALSHRFDR